MGGKSNRLMASYTTRGHWSGMGVGDGEEVTRGSARAEAVAAAGLRRLTSAMRLSSRTPLATSICASASAVSNGLDRNEPRKPGIAQKEQAWSQPSATRSWKRSVSGRKGTEAAPTSTLARVAEVVSEASEERRRSTYGACRGEGRRGGGGVRGRGEPPPEAGVVSECRYLRPPHLLWDLRVRLEPDNRVHLGDVQGAYGRAPVLLQSRGAHDGADRLALGVLDKGARVDDDHLRVAWLAHHTQTVALRAPPAAPACAAQHDRRMRRAGGYSRTLGARRAAAGQSAGPACAPERRYASEAESRQELRRSARWPPSAAVAHAEPHACPGPGRSRLRLTPAATCRVPTPWTVALFVAAADYPR
eukprot:scaffold4598_cov100-Isochrysis_galbana.AAC.1